MAPIAVTTDPGFGSATFSTFTRGEKIFELSNHLGNVLTTISDRKIAVDDGTYHLQCYPGFGCSYVKDNSTPDGLTDYYGADIVTANDYYPFGMIMPGRKFTQGSSYRYGFNGQEKSEEISEGLTTAQFWEYDSRIGRRWNKDPKPDVSTSLYSCFLGNPIFNSDILGDKPSDWVTRKNADGTFTPTWEPHTNAKNVVLKVGEEYWGKNYRYADKNGTKWKLTPGNATPILDKDNIDPKKPVTNHSPTQAPVNSKPTPGKPSSGYDGSSPNGDKEGAGTGGSNGDPNKNPNTPTSPSPPGIGIGGGNPDFFTINVSSPMQLPKGILPEKLNIPFTGALSVTNDRHGNIYITPLNATATGTTASASLTYYFMTKPSNPNEKQLNGFLTGTGYNISGGNLFGGSIMTNDKLDQWAIGVGYTTSGVSGSVSHQPAQWVYKHVGLTWGQ
ncbi:hypothetical protein GCM10027043_04390 [Ferruginibacter profundus]